MPNEEHKAKLWEGVEVWNAWRTQNPNIRPDLSHAVCFGHGIIDLRGINFSGTNLHGASFSEVNLRTGDWSYFTRKRSHVNLSAANLRGADLTQADLTGANLTRADLTGVNLTKADLKAVDLRGATLADCIGLREVSSWKDTQLDPITVFKYRKQLPPEFVRDANLPEEVREMLKTGDLIEIEFKRSVWGQLIPIEQALSATLGEHYVVEKSKDRILVILNSPDQFQDALDALLPALAGLEAESPGETKALSAEPRDGNLERLQDDQLSQLLQYIAVGYEQTHSELHQIIAMLKSASPEKSRPQRLLLAALRSLPIAGELAAVATELGLEATAPSSPEERGLGRRIFHSFKRFFRGANEVAELPVRKDRDPPLLPAGDRENESDHSVPPPTRTP